MVVRFHWLVEEGDHGNLGAFVPADGVSVDAITGVQNVTIRMELPESGGRTADACLTLPPALFRSHSLREVRVELLALQCDQVGGTY